MPLCFYKRPILVPIFTNQRRSKQNFCLYKKKKVALEMQAFCKREWHNTNFATLGDTCRQVGDREKTCPLSGSSHNRFLKYSVFEENVDEGEGYKTQGGGFHLSLCLFILKKNKLNMLYIASHPKYLLKMLFNAIYREKMHTL